MKEPLESMTESKADQALNRLVRSQSDSCLWHLRRPGRLSVRDPAAGVVLQAIIRRGTREVWQQAKALQAWRFRHIK